VIAGEFRIMHYSSQSVGSDLDFGEDPRTGFLHFEPVDLTGFQSKTFRMEIRDLGSNTTNDEVVVRLLVNDGTMVTLLDTRPQAHGTAGHRTLSYSFDDFDWSARLLIDVLSDDDGDGYAFDAIVFEGLANPDAPVFSARSFSRPAGRSTVAYSGSVGREATDANGDLLQYAKVEGPAWLKVAADGALSGLPTLNDMGGNHFTLMVTDGKDGSDTAELVIPINDPSGNPPPPPSDTEHYRLIWEGDPTTSAVLAWKQRSGANGTVYFGTEDFGRSE
jgi:hypothetical protein